MTKLKVGDRVKHTFEQKLYDPYRLEPIVVYGVIESIDANANARINWNYPRTARITNRQPVFAVRELVPATAPAKTA